MVDIYHVLFIGFCKASVLCQCLVTTTDLQSEPKQCKDTLYNQYTDLQSKYCNDTAI